MKNKKKYYAYLLVFIILFMTACSPILSINEVKNDKYIDEQVKLRGTVENSIKIGELSGFILIDENGDSIPVSSNALPAEGEIVTVKGILKKDLLLSYYIQTEN